MAKKATPWFKFFPDDWHGGTKHLDHTERACYLDLLIFQFTNGAIPTEPLVRMNLCGITDVGQWERIWRHVGDKFEVDNDGAYSNPRMQEIRTEAIDGHRSAREAGQRGAAKRWGDHSNPIGNPISNPNANQNQNQNQNQKKEPDKKRKKNPPKSPKGDYSPEFQKFWSAFPSGRKTAKGDAWKAWKESIQAALPSTLIDCAGEYARSDAGRGEYVKGPASWLRKRCWEDDRAAWNDHTEKPELILDPNDPNFDPRAKI